MTAQDAPNAADVLRAAAAPPRSRVGLRVGTTPTADHRDADLTFVGGDLIAFFAPLGSALPTDFSNLDGSIWKCAGWLEAGTGFSFKFGDTIKEVMGAGSWFPIRSLIASRTARTIDVSFLEGINPVARALFDDVPISYLKPDDTETVASYIPGDKAWKNHYACVFDGFDGDKKMRIAAPDVFVSARGTDQLQQLDVDPLPCTLLLNPQDIDGTVGAYRRIIDYSTVPDTSSYFTS